MAEKFSPSILSFLKSTFDDFDKDGDGKLTKDDIACMMRFSGENPTDEEIQLNFKEFDVDKNQKVDFAEYVSVVAKKLTGKGKNSVLMSFQSLDKDKDGFLSRDDLSQTFDDDKIEEMLKFDLDQDGKLSHEEFAKWVKGHGILGELLNAEEIHPE